jgi:hypothetical protein
MGAEKLKSNMKLVVSGSYGRNTQNDPSWDLMQESGRPNRHLYRETLLCIAETRVKLDGLGGNLQHKGRRIALHPRSVYRFKAALHGLRCHPLTCMLLKMR